MVPDMLKKACLLPLLWLIAMSVSASTSPLRIANVIIPASFASALEDGLAVPVRLQYTDEGNRIDTQTDDSIGNATLMLQDGKLHLLHIDFSAGQQQGVLNDTLTAMLSSKKRRTFSADGSLQIDGNASMQLDLVAMLLTIRVSREAFGQAKQPYNRVALTPTVDSLTGVHRYNLGYSFINNQQSGHSDSNFLQLDSTVGLGAHHVAMDASLYNLGQPEQSGDIYRAMYERDLDDRRVAAGMVSTWDLQTLGVVTGLTTGRIYGASYGNQAQSRKQATNESTTPVQVFMPANGEARVYRDERLIGLQNLPIGNQHLDTSSFPNGVYNVRVEVYVDGRLTSTTTQRVTKLGGNQGFTREWGWQWWGGMMESSQNNGDSPLLGLSLARSLGTLELATTTYAFKEAAVGEARASWQATEHLGTQLQGMLASDHSWRLASSLSLQVHDNASLWVSQEKLEAGSALTVGETELYSAGITLNLGGWISGLGQLTFNTTHDRQMSSDRSYVDYYQHLYAGRYGNLSMRASLQSDSGTLNGFSNKSITLDYSIPFDNLFSFGMSSNEQGQTTANLSYQKRMEGVIILATIIPTLLLAPLTNRFVVVSMVAMLWCGAIGFLDDYLKVVEGQSRGLVAKWKLAGQVSFGVTLGVLLILWPVVNPSTIPAAGTTVPFFKFLIVTFAPWLYVVFVTGVVTGFSNAVNLTDGLDGLATGLSTIAAGTFAFFAYILGRVDTTGYLNLFYLPGSGELAVFCSALVGACLGFLWFNAHPAKVFMGDTGSLALGGTFGTVAILLKSEFLLVIIGGVFVAEAGSVMLQTSVYKWNKRTRGARVCRCASRLPDGTAPPPL